MDLFSTKVAYAASIDVFMGNVITHIINPVIGFMFALAIVYFLWGLAEFIFNQENEEKKTTGKSHMIWGIIGITIMMGVWTILSLIMNTLNVQGIELNPTEVNLPR